MPLLYKKTEAADESADSEEVEIDTDISENDQ